MDSPILMLIDFYEFGKKIVDESKIRKILIEIEKKHLRNHQDMNLDKINYIMEILSYCFSINEIDLMNSFLDYTKLKIHDERLIEYLVELCIDYKDLKILKFLIFKKIDINNFRNFISNRIDYDFENVHDMFYFDKRYEIAKHIIHPMVNDFYSFLFFYLHFDVEFVKIARCYINSISNIGESRFDTQLFMINLMKHYHKKTFETSIFGFLYGGFNSKFVGKLSVENFYNMLDFL